jgi:D-arabinose 1-dehydrogenase-like Zn-dependent alcohol dehydrogenase
MTVPMPQQLDHEAAGNVVQVGSSATRFSVGDKVVLLPNPACGRCVFCCRGLDNLCIDTSLSAYTSSGAYANTLCARRRRF